MVLDWLDQTKFDPWNSQNCLHISIKYDFIANIFEGFRNFFFMFNEITDFEGKERKILPCKWS